MSILAQLGGTELAPTTLRMAAMGLASYGALTWVQQKYGVDILSATPNRILAAGVIAVASEFALRTFSSEKAMHLSRLKSSVRALQKDLQDPANQEGVRSILTDAGYNVSKESMEGLINGDYGSPDFKEFITLTQKIEATERKIDYIAEMLDGVIDAEVHLEEEEEVEESTKSPRKSKKKDGADAATQIRTLKGQLTKERNKTARLSDTVDKQADAIQKLQAQMAEVLGMEAAG